MEEFSNWFFSNLYTNIFTIITVVVSCAFSLLISALYFHKGNRNNLKLSVIHPICSLLKNEFNKTNYEKLSDLSRDFTTRYMKKSERNVLINLLKAYNEVTKMNEIDIYADALFSYFEYKLNKYGIEIKVVPNEFEDGTIIYHYPPEIDQLYYALQDFLREEGYKYWEDYACSFSCTLEDKIKSIYFDYGKDFINSNSITFFDKLKPDDIVRKSKKYREYQSKISALHRHIKDFFELKICKSLQRSNLKYNKKSKKIKLTKLMKKWKNGNKNK